MATSTQSDSPSLNTINNLFGTSLEFPKCFRKPGTSSNFELKSGSGHIGFDGSAASFNLNPTSPLSTLTNGIAQVNGYQNIFGALTVTGLSLFLGGVRGNTSFWTLETGAYTITSSGGLNLTSSDTASITGVDVSINSALSLTLNGRNWDVSAATWDAKKPFDILHPTKSDHRLRYVCVESPTADVYVRGKLDDSNVIELPEYWKNLVDIETISVVLTPYKNYQELFVEKIESETKIIIKNNSASKIECDYIVYGERKDTSKNIPEYKGKTPNDYPGDNREYVINGGVSNLQFRS
jgi:hypothetical protein